MFTITIYKPSKPQGEEFKGVENMTIQDGVLTFVYKPDSSQLFARQIRTTVPFVVDEEVED